MSPPRTLRLGLLLALLGACAHSVFEASAGQLKTDATDFEKQAFLAARRREGNDLTITDMEVVDVQMSQDAKQAVVMSRMRWVKLPSA